MADGPLFILAGNGSDYNRGCEAIQIGTLKILRRYFPGARFRVVSYFPTRADFDRQRRENTEPDVELKAIRRICRRFDRYWFLYKALQPVAPGCIKHIMYRDVKRALPEAKAVLALGGDNYSIDMGRRPTACTDLDDLVTAAGTPMVIWGASVGPFSEQPDYERFMAQHLRPLHIFAREPLTLEYLRSLGLSDRVRRVGDPAFLMDARAPEPAVQIAPHAIGVNLSPLVGRFVGGGDRESWVSQAVQIVQAIRHRFDRPVYLIPHVFGGPENSDYLFLQQVHMHLPHQDGVFLANPEWKAPHLKWLISRMELFAGARTHATIAAWSSYVPTLSFSYSVKSRGLNQDLFGHCRYCLDIKQAQPEIVIEALERLDREAPTVREQLVQRIPEVQALAMQAGSYLQDVLRDSFCAG